MKPSSAILLGDFEYSKQAEGAQHWEAERWRRLHCRPDDLEDGARDDHAVEPVEGRLEVDPRAERVHLDQHFRDEQPEEHEFCVVWDANASQRVTTYNGTRTDVSTTAAPNVLPSAV